jgi:transposase
MFTNFVGIDVSKSKFDLALIKGQDKDHVIQGVFDNTRNGIKTMSKFLEKEHHVQLSETIFCMEFTGVYCYPLTDFFVKKECHVWIEMPVNIIRSLGLQRGKNDRVDAHRIALYAYKNRDDVKLWKPQREAILRLRTCYHFVRGLSLLKSLCKCLSMKKSQWEIKKVLRCFAKAARNL